MKKSFLSWFIFGLLLRIILMPLTFHPDLRGHYLGASFIANQNEWLTFYDHISKLPRSHPIVNQYRDNFLVYAPLTYWVHAIWLKVTSPIINWDTFDKFVIDYGSAIKEPGTRWLVFILKMPYLLIDIACLYLLLKIVGEKHAHTASMLWAINFPVIYSAFLMGQFDIFLVLFFLLALLFVKKNMQVKSAIFLGLSACFKPFSLFMIPFLPGNVFKNLAIGLGTYLLVIFPYLISSPAFRQYALVAEHSDKLWYAKILVSGSQYIPVFFFLVVACFWVYYFRPWILPKWLWISTPLFFFYSSTHFHPQWSAWVTPFTILYFISYPRHRLPIYVIYICFLLIMLSFDSSLNFGLFGINFDLFAYLNKFYPKDQLISFIRGVLAASFFIITFLSNNKSKQDLISK